MRGMMEMRGIRMGIQGIQVEMRGLGGRNEGNQGKNLRIGVEMMNKK